MGEITNDLIYEVLKKIQDQVARTHEDVRTMREELSAIRGHMLSMQKDIHNIYDLVHDHSRRLDRIERRLDLADAPV